MRPLLAGLALTLLLSGQEGAAQTAGSRPRAAAPAATRDPEGAPPFAFPSPGAAFVTIEPTTTRDRFDPASIAAPGAGSLSLREAMALANRLDVPATIVLRHNAVYRLDLCGPFDSTANSRNELVHTVNRELTISGAGATIVQSCDGAGVLVQQGGDQLFNMADLRITGGRARHVPAGAVWSSGTGEVRISNAVVDDNRATLRADRPRLAAGAVAANGYVILSGVTFARNVSDSGAGAVAAEGAVKAVKSSFIANSGPRAGAIVAGGAALPALPPGPPLPTGITPQGLTLIQATLSGNSAPQVALTGGTFTSFASVVAGPAACAEAVSVRSLGYNAIDGCGVGGGSGDLGGAASLAATRGPLGGWLLAPGPGSSLIDAIPPDRCLPSQVAAMIPVYTGARTDQLGVARPKGAGCDIGAVELVTQSLSRPTADAPHGDLPISAPPAAPAAMDVLRVTTTQDRLGGRALSLRGAFIRAERSRRDVRILLEPGAVYRLDRCAPPQAALDNLSNGLVQSSEHALELYGNGATIVQSCDGSGVFVRYGHGRLLLNGVTLTGGHAGHPGGGLFMASTGEARLEQVWITANSSSAAGGGVAAFGDVILIGSSITGNHSDEFGGGLIGTANADLTDSFIFDNSAGIAIGGLGLRDGHVTLNRSLIARNTGPNLAAGSADADDSIIADFVPGGPFPGIGGPPGAGPPPPGSGPPPGAAVAGGPPPGFPPPANCDLRQPTRGHNNLATDRSCGFDRVEPTIILVPNRATAPTRLSVDPRSR